MAPLPDQVTADGPATSAAATLAVERRPPLDRAVPSDRVSPPDGPVGGGDAGRPGVVVAVHGAMDRGGSFRRLARHLPDIELVTYDRRGYAGSYELGPSECFGDQVEDLCAVVDGRPSILVGHSFGANVVLAMAEQHPELVRAAVVYEPPAPWQPEWGGGMTQKAAQGRSPEDTAEWFMRHMIGNRVWERLPESTREQRRAEGATFLSENRALRAGRPYDPAAVAVPVVVGWGSNSTARLRRAAGVVAGELPHAIGMEIPGATHSVHLGHPAALADMIRLAGRLAPDPGG